MVVVRDGRVIAERYAPGYDIDTQVLGWSATKSVTNALIGILVRQGRLAVEGPAPIAPWADPRDPRHAISVVWEMTSERGTEGRMVRSAGRFATEAGFVMALMLRSPQGLGRTSRPDGPSGP